MMREIVVGSYVIVARAIASHALAAFFQKRQPEFSQFA
jgi:hypothetical protein